MNPYDIARQYVHEADSDHPTRLGILSKELLRVRTPLQESVSRGEQTIGFNWLVSKESIFPRKLTIKLQSTGDVVHEIEINEKGTYMIPPMNAGSYLLEWYPYDPTFPKTLEVS